MKLKIEKVAINVKSRELQVPQGMKITEKDDLKWPFTMSFYGLDYNVVSSVISTFNTSNYKELSTKLYAFKFEKDITWIRVKWSNLINE